MDYPKKPKIILQICSILFGSIGFTFLMAEIYFFAIPMIKDFDLTILLFMLPISLLACLPIYACYGMLKKYSEQAISKLLGIFSIFTYFVITSFDDHIINIATIPHLSKHEVEMAFFGITLLASYLIFRVGKHYLLSWAINSNEINKAQHGAAQRTT